MRCKCAFAGEPGNSYNVITHYPRLFLLYVSTVFVLLCLCDYSFFVIQNHFDYTRLYKNFLCTDSDCSTRVLHTGCHSTGCRYMLLEVCWSLVSKRIASAETKYNLKP